MASHLSHHIVSENQLPEPATTLVTPRVLLVEDDAPNVVVARFFVEKFGYVCDVASNGIEAIQKLNNHFSSYIAVLMDVRMPGMNGFEATKIIREEEKKNNRTHLPIIGMTGLVLKGDREKCLAAGMDDYIPKPFNLKELHKKLKTFLTLHYLKTA